MSYEKAVAAEYFRLRKEHPYNPAKQTILWARGNVKPTNLEWDVFGAGYVATAKGTHDGFDINVTVDYDQYGDYPVEETDDDTGIRNPDFVWTGDEYGSRRHKRFVSLESGETLRDLVPYYHRQGDAKNVAWERARQSLQDEAKGYMGQDYVQVAITVTASKKGIRLGSASIGSDFIVESYGTFDKELDNAVVECGLVEEATTEARQNLLELLTDGALTQ